jgi:thiamine monophosphate kinase
VELGIGDDAASLSFPQPASCLVAVDMLMEECISQFRPSRRATLGRKALVN